MTTLRSINDAIIATWKAMSPSERGPLMPLLYPELTPRGITFVGFNPSYPKKLRNSVDAPLYKVSRLQHNYTALLRAEKDMLDTYAYFSPIREIAMSLKRHWNHLDLFLYRESSQKNLEPKVWNGKHLTDYGQRQLSIFKKALTYCAPEAIIVINAKASDIFRSHFSLAPCGSSGWYDSPVLGCPIHLASVISGARAMDRFSRDRLAWMIRRSLQ